MVSTHSENETLFYCLILERGETLGEASSPPCANLVSRLANPSNSQGILHLLFLHM